MQKTGKSISSEKYTQLKLVKTIKANYLQFYFYHNSEEKRTAPEVFYVCS